MASRPWMSGSGPLQYSASSLKKHPSVTASPVGHAATNALTKSRTTSSALGGPATPHIVACPPCDVESCGESDREGYGPDGGIALAVLAPSRPPFPATGDAPVCANDDESNGVFRVVTRTGTQRKVRTRLVCGAAAGPLFVGIFSASGLRRPGYMWQQHTVSTLAATERGWQQRENVVLAGGLYLLAVSGLRRAAGRRADPRAVPVLIAGAGLRLIGSGIFVTDPVAGYPRRSCIGNASVAGGVVATHEGGLHTLCAIPILFGIPLAGMVSAIATLRQRDTPWATYSFGSSMAMAGNFALMGMAFGGDPRLLAAGRAASDECGDRQS